MGRIAALSALLALVAALTACGSRSEEPLPVVDETATFETGLEAWTPRAFDTTVGPGDEIAWSIAPSSELASSGTSSAKVSVDNRTDAAKVWLEKEYDLAPGTAYAVRVDFDFATSDFGDLNTWTIIAGATAQSANDASLLPFTADTTSGGPQPTDGYTWLAKSYHDRVTVGDDGKLFVSVGVWGTWEALRTYYLDNLHVIITPVPKVQTGAIG